MIRYYPDWRFHETRKIVSEMLSNFAEPIARGWRERLYAFCEGSIDSPHGLAVRFIVAEKSA